MQKYNTDKPHRCPSCHSTTVVPHPQAPTWWSVRSVQIDNWLDELTEDLEWRHPLRRLTRTLGNLLAPADATRVLTLASVICCRCGTEITRWPKMPVFKRRGIICQEHLPGAHGTDKRPAEVTETLCGRPVGTRPWWMSEDQYNECPCLRPHGHDGPCVCIHGEVS